MPVDLDQLRHPDYERMARRWQMGWDFWRGGIHVLAPDHETGSVRFAVPRTADDDAGEKSPTPPRTENEWTWEAAPNNSYLFKHEKETLPEFRERAQRQVHLPVFQYVANVYSAGILRAGFEDKPEGWWADYYADVDLAGTSMDAFRRQKLALALVFGRIHTLSDRTAGPPAQSLAEEQRRGDRAYSYLVTPLDVVDWCLDDRGRFVWVRIREAMPDTREWDTPAPDEAWRYRVWTKDEWHLYAPTRADGKDAQRTWVEVASGRHGAGRVPLATTWATKDGRKGNMACESPLADVLDFDHQLLNDFSEQQELDRAQSFATLFIPEREGSPLGGIEMGPWRAQTCPAEAPMPAYVAPPADLANSRWQRTQEKLFVIRQLAGASRGKAEYSKEERSAASLDIEAEDKRNLMAWWASAAEEGDREQLAQVAALEKQAETPEPKYPRTFDIKGMQTLIAELTQLGSIEVMKKAPEAIAALAAPIVERKLREHGVKEEAIAAALKAVKEAGAEEPEPPPAPFGAAPMPAEGDKKEPDDVRRGARGGMGRPGGMDSSDRD